MLRVAIILILLFNQLFSYSSHAINAYAVSLYNESMKEEPIQGKHKTSKDYEGVVYTKIYAFGQFFQEQPRVQIGTSKGKQVLKKPIVKNGVQIGYEMIFKHFTVRSGYLEVYIGNKLFDRSLYVK